MDEKNKNIYEILLGREKRAYTQKKLIDTFKTPLISFTLNIPGAEKISSSFYKVYQTGMNSLKSEMLKDNFKLVHELEDQSAAGYEAFFNVEGDVKKIKRLTVSIEEKHSLGRLFDFDVFDANGNHLSRIGLGLPERKCLICGQKAAICSRSRKHSVGELLDKINSMINDFYVQK